ncbi:hypothetical protein OOK31_00775 [Streptomyces sp. NBC_00249]|uniref:hypothetical protein n=1 Tax=Streptomyces sp. NBC_00249 TaxID=2975690 RepID=UPI00224D2324|nr:hypothetical protein [Streptomyces sp. NBC_00249]MCX5192433.1 hypothetical protein [Streptomyces sp. NBC_00249]
MFTSYSVLLVVVGGWLLIALIPMRTRSGRRGLAAFVLGVSALLIVAAGVVASQAEKSADFEGSPALIAMGVVGLLVAPAVIAALVRLARAGGRD